MKNEQADLAPRQPVMFIVGLCLAYMATAMVILLAHLPYLLALCGPLPWAK